MINNSFTMKVFLLCVICAFAVTQGECQQIVKSQKRLTNIIDSYPMPSPDGKQVAFQSNRTGDWEIFVMNIDGTNLKNITQSPGTDVNPGWSLDGRRIVFDSERDNDPEVYIMNTPMELNSKD